MLPEDVPAVALESNPGDVVCMHQMCKHASFGGTSRRRMFTINCTPRYVGEEGAEFLRREMMVSKLVEGPGFALRSDVYEGVMLETASEQRMVHLEQAVGQREFFMEQVRNTQRELEEAGEEPPDVSYKMPAHAHAQAAGK